MKTSTCTVIVKRGKKMIFKQAFEFMRGRPKGTQEEHIADRAWIRRLIGHLNHMTKTENYNGDVRKKQDEIENERAKLRDLDVRLMSVRSQRDQIGTKLDYQIGEVARLKRSIKRLKAKGAKKK